MARWDCPLTSSCTPHEKDDHDVCAAKRSPGVECQRAATGIPVILSAFVGSPDLDRVTNPGARGIDTISRDVWGTIKCHKNR